MTTILTQGEYESLPENTLAERIGTHDFITVYSKKTLLHLSCR